MAAPLSIPKDLLDHYGYVRRLARDLLEDGHAAEEVAQDAMVAALERPRNVAKGTRAWLNGVVKNLVRNRTRSELRRRDVTALLTDGGEPDEPTASQAIERGEQRAQLARAIMDLREPYRTVVVLRYMEEQTPPQIAKALGRPLETVQTQLHRALGLLRQELDSRSGGDRRQWAKALVPLAAPKVVIGAAALSGAGVLGAPIMIACVAVLGIVGAALLRTGEAAGPEQVAGREPVSLGELRGAAAEEWMPAPEAASVASKRVIVHPADPAAAAIPRSVRLRVLGPGGEGVAGALVASSGSRSRSWVTDDRGMSIVELSSSMRVRVEAEGYRPVSCRLSPGQEQDLLVELTPLVSRTVHVIDRRTGKGLSDVHVCVVPYMVAGAGYAPEVLDGLKARDVAMLVLGGMGSLATAAVQVGSSLGEEQDLVELDAVVPEAVSDLPMYSTGSTGDDGRAVVETWGEGPWMVDVSVPGYAREMLDADSGEWSEELLVRMEAAASIRLIRGGKDPGVTLDVTLQGAFDDRCRHVCMLDGESEVVVDDLCPGSYSITVRTADRHSFAPGVASDPSEVRVGANEEAIVHLTVPLGADLLVDIDACGVDLEGEMFVFVVQGGMSEPVGMAEVEGGQAVIHALEPGDYEIQLVGRDGVHCRREVRVEPPSEVEQRVTLRVEPGSLLVEQSSTEPDGHGIVILTGPTEAPLDERSQLAQFSSEVLFSGLQPGRYHVWILRGEQAWKEVVEVGGGRGRVAFDLTRRPDGSLDIHRGRGFDPAMAIELKAADGTPIPIGAGLGGLLGITPADLQTDGATLSLDLPRGRYRIGYGLTGSGWREQAIDVTEQSKVVLEERSPPAALRVRLSVDGRAMRPGDIVTFTDLEGARTRRRSQRVELGSGGVGSVALRPGQYRVLDPMGRSTIVEVCSGDRSLTIELR